MFKKVMTYSKHSVVMALYMVISGAMAFETYAEHPLLDRADNVIARAPTSANYYCASDTICTYTTYDKGWWKDEANYDCADKCSDYNAADMTSNSKWIDCGWTKDSCAASAATSRTCTITFAGDITTNPTAVVGTGTVALNIGDLS